VSATDLEIITGDCLTALHGLADQRFHAIVTSPPCYKEGNYNHPSQLGHEASLGEYASEFVRVMREARRMLRDDGGAGVVLGDRYASSAHGRAATCSVRRGVSRSHYRMAAGSCDRAFQHGADPPCATRQRFRSKYRCAMWRYPARRTAACLTRSADRVRPASLRKSWVAQRRLSRWFRQADFGRHRIAETEAGSIILRLTIRELELDEAAN
jgi:hypothetical protein